jgi:hypothetical protein
VTDLEIDLSLLLQLATLISVVIGVIGLMISVRAYRRQVNSQFMLEYTRRVDDLLSTLPPHVLGLTVIRADHQPPPPPSDELSTKVLRCLNLVSQMHFFSHKGFLPPVVWRRARVIYARILRSPLFRREWQTLRPAFEMDRAFCRYVDKVQRLSPEELAAAHKDEEQPDEEHDESP